MNPDSQQLEDLKYILENSLQPERLDQHPWAQSLVAGLTEGQGLHSGQRLVTAIAHIFIETMPAAPPRHGKRLDTRWGEFGLLAAQYFAPLLYGAPVPSSLRDAWGRIDQSILLFAYDRPSNTLTQAEKDAYNLVKDELEIAPHSTLSDWHRKGLQYLLQSILVREAYLSKSLSRPAVISAGGHELRAPLTRPASLPCPARWRRVIFTVWGLLLLGLVAAGGLKVRQVYNQAMHLKVGADQLQAILSSPSSNLERIRQAGPALTVLRADFLVLKAEVTPLLWLGPWLGWVPEYGGELAASQDLMSYADSLLAAGDLALEGISPLLASDHLAKMTLTELTLTIRQAGPQLLQARQALEQARIARARLDPQRLSPRVRNLIVDKIDPGLVWMQDGLALALEFPRLMGATNEGPKTYLLLAQNEDELRPTGGFITAAGTVLVQNGSISAPVFQNSGYLDDWSKPYPVAPWQLSHYMNSPVLIFRDTNWFTNYPTAALYAEQLYSYVNAHSVDGVIAFDQKLLVRLLRVTGPIKLSSGYAVNADNVIGYMRQAKTPTAEDLANPNWNNKLFVTAIARGLLEKIIGGQVNPEKLTAALLDALNERDLLVQVDNQNLTDFLARQGWDGSVRPGGADFLMVADSNIGYNKTSAVIESQIEYEVDLRSTTAPTALLSVTHRNNAARMLTCTQWGKTRAEGEKDYPITDCYWDYMRVYRAGGTSLLDFAAQFIPANWMLNYHSVPPQVDVLGNEEIEAIQAFGTLKVVRGGQSETTRIRFGLPLTVFQAQSGSELLAYRLRVQKQPGTEAVPLSIRVYLPPGAAISHTPDRASVQNNVVSFSINLRTDLEFEIVFGLP